MAEDDDVTALLEHELDETPPPVKAKAPDTGEAFDMITYLAEEPRKTTWNGVEFVTGKPVKVLRRQTIDQLVKIEQEMPDGTIKTHSVSRRVPMVVSARTNPDFRVNDEEPAQRLKGSARLPDNPDHYRGWAMKWMSEETDIGAFNIRWQREAALRVQCGWTAQDEERLQPFIDYRVALLEG